MLITAKVFLFFVLAACVLGLGGTLFMAGYAAFLQHADEAQRFAGAAFMLAMVAAGAGSVLAMLENTKHAIRMRRIRNRNARRAAIRS